MDYRLDRLRRGWLIESMNSEIQAAVGKEDIAGARAVVRAIGS